MSIEPSTVVLTIISFCILMAVLHFMLFRPVLKLMHDRRDKIENCKTVKNKSAEKLEEQNRLISSRLEDALRNERESYEKRMKKAESDSTEEQNRYQKAEDNRLAEIKDELALEQEKMEKEFGTRLPEFAKTLADQLVSKDY